MHKTGGVIPESLYQESRSGGMCGFPLKRLQEWHGVSDCGNDIE